MLTSSTGYVPNQGVQDTGVACVIATLTKKGKNDPTSSDISKRNFPSPYDQSSNARTLTVDHICKSSTVRP